MDHRCCISNMVILCVMQINLFPRVRITEEEYHCHELIKEDCYYQERKAKYLAGHDQ